MDHSIRPVTVQNGSSYIYTALQYVKPLLFYSCFADLLRKLDDWKCMLKNKTVVVRIRSSWCVEFPFLRRPVGFFSFIITAAEIIKQLNSREIIRVFVLFST